MSKKVQQQMVAEENTPEQSCLQVYQAVCTIFGLVFFSRKPPQLRFSYVFTSSVEGYKALIL